MPQHLVTNIHRDHERGIDTQIPENYFPNNDPNKTPLHQMEKSQ